MYKTICASIAAVVTKLIDAIKTQDQKAKPCIEKILFLLQENRKKLSELEKCSGVVLETPELKKLCDIAQNFGCAAKLSGAGGGDCGIAVCFDEKAAKNVLRAWKENNIYPIDVFKTV